MYSLHTGLHTFLWYSETTALRKSSQYEHPYITQLARCKRIRIPESAIFLFAEFWNPVHWNPEYSSWNPESHERLQSRIQVPLTENPELVPGIRSPWCGVHNPKLSWIPLHRAIYDSLICPDRKPILYFVKLPRLTRTPGKRTLFCAPSQKLSYILYPALLTLVTCPLSFLLLQSCAKSKSKSNTVQISHMGYMCTGKGEQLFSHSNGFY